MRTPVDFIVTRHLLSHPFEGASEIRDHCHLKEEGPTLRLSSIARALDRVLEETEGHERLLFRRLVDHAERPRHKTVHLSVADAVQTWDQWHEKFDRSHWLSGEFAAVAVEEYPLVPHHCLIYVRPADLQEAVRYTMKRFFAKTAPVKRANFSIRAADPWLYTEETEDGVGFVEPGQRRLDYRESGHILLTEEYGR